jgi:hypothetical protein
LGSSWSIIAEATTAMTNDEDVRTLAGEAVCETAKFSAAFAVFRPDECVLLSRSAMDNPRWLVCHRCMVDFLMEREKGGDSSPEGFGGERRMVKEQN